MFLVFYLRRFVSRLLTRQALVRISVKVLLIYLAMGLGVLLVEKGDPNSNIKTIWDALWFPLITLTTVGYGDFYPVTPAGYIVTGLGIVIGLGFVATLLSELPVMAMERSRWREEGMGETKFKNHAIICHWDPEDGPALIQELLAGDSQIQQVVVVSEGERPFQDNRNQQWIAGIPSDEATLQRAGILHASAVIALPAPKAMERPEGSDAQALMLVSTIRSLSSAWLGIMLEREENRRHFLNASAIINPSRLGTMLMVQALQDSGVEIVAERLFSNLQGNTLFCVSVSQDFVGSKIQEVYLRTNWIPVALVRGGEIIENPDKETILQAGDALIIIAPNRPTEAEEE